MNIMSEKVSFPGSLGHLLEGRVDLPEGPIKYFAVYAPCFTCTKDVLAARRICKGMAEQGIGVLSIDFTG